MSVLARRGSSEEAVKGLKRDITSAETGNLLILIEFNIGGLAEFSMSPRSSTWVGPVSVK